MEIDIKVYILIIIGISLMILGFIIQFIDMMIDHQCYQLQPNDNYQSTICERYWIKGSDTNGKD